MRDYGSRVSTRDRVLVSHDGAAWLPAEGRADVVLAGELTVVPAPVCLARLLVMRDDRILVETRPDGRGLDIPTRVVRDGRWQEPVRNLVRRVGAPDDAVSLLGYVRNVVNGGHEDYPWPSPHAYFAVWHCRLPAPSSADRTEPGTWLDESEAAAELGERHWWPLAAHVRSLG